jgi:hypothetical protein
LRCCGCYPRAAAAGGRRRCIAAAAAGMMSVSSAKGGRGRAVGDEGADCAMARALRWPGGGPAARGLKTKSKKARLRAPERARARALPVAAMDDASLTRALHVAIAAAKEAGAVIQAAHSAPKAILTKATHVDLVTETDKKCEEIIIERLQEAFPSFRRAAQAERTTPPHAPVRRRSSCCRPSERSAQPKSQSAV